MEERLTLSPTLRDVARKAGVSMKTASRVANHQGEVSDETRGRVLTAIRELGYRPSKLARGLATHRTDTIGLVLGDISNPFFPEVARLIASGLTNANICAILVMLLHPS